MPDKTTTIKELRDLVDNFRKQRNWCKATPAMFAKDIAVEAGELLDHFVWDEEAYAECRKRMQKANDAISWTWKQRKKFRNS